jgi:hypothetical protein
MMLSWSFRMISHTRTETQTRIPRGEVVGNIGQWSHARSNNITWVKKGIVTCQDISLSFDHDKT